MMTEKNVNIPIPQGTDIKGAAGAKRMGCVKIYHAYSKDIERDAVYIETDMSSEDVADIVIGLQFYIEENTTNGSNCCITQEMAAYMMTEYFGCRLIPKDSLPNDLPLRRYKGEGCEDFNYDCDICGFDPCWLPCRENSVDLYSDRESRLGHSVHAKCMKKVEHLEGTEFLTKLCRYYDNEEPWGNELTVKEILELY